MGNISRKTVSLSAGALVLALAAGIGIGKVAAEDRQPHMAAAMEHLRQAEQELNQAEHDKGGHREKALQLVKQAENQVQAGMRFDRQHEDRDRDHDHDNDKH